MRKNKRVLSRLFFSRKYLNKLKRLNATGGQTLLFLHEQERHFVNFAASKAVHMKPYTPCEKILSIEIKVSEFWKSFKRFSPAWNSWILAQYPFILGGSTSGKSPQLFLLAISFQIFYLFFFFCLLSP